MIVSVCLSRGAIAMSRKKVIVKRLNSIQNLGAMDVLCTDKTGTLTLDRVILEKHCDVVRNEDDEVLTLAYLNSHFQTGLKNVLDRAILAASRRSTRSTAVPDYTKVDEIPFDFSRKRDVGRRRDARGRPPPDLQGRPGGGLPALRPLRAGRQDLPRRPAADRRPEGGVRRAQRRRLPRAGDRLPGPRAAGGLLQGRRARPDPAGLRGLPRSAQGHRRRPPSPPCRSTASRSRCSPATTNWSAARSARRSASPTDQRAPGQPGRSECPTPNWPRPPERRRSSPGSPRPTSSASSAPCRARGTSSASWATASTTRPPCAPPTWASPSTRAVDIAKESADIILLEKSLLVLEEGVLEGRKVFANILKYIRMGASSNFGNMFSVLGASAFLPFLPMAPDPDPDQQSALRLLAGADSRRRRRSGADRQAAPLADGRDHPVHPVHRPVQLDLRLHDLLHDALRLRLLGPGRASLFQTGWFVESLLTQTLIIHIIRTNRIPFLQSWASWPLIVTTAVIMAIRRVAAVFADCGLAWLHATAAALLAAGHPDAVLLCRLDTNCQVLVDTQEVDLRGMR